jgi:hypothetical protein
VFYFHLLVGTDILQQLVLSQGFAEGNDELLEPFSDDRIAIGSSHGLTFENL